MNSLLSFLFSLVQAVPLPPLHPLPLVRLAPERLAGSALVLALEHWALERVQDLVPQVQDWEQAVLGRPDSSVPMLA